jgi:2-dehydropantoate 2-reductase
MRIAIMGSGGVGGYFGARLAAAGQDVTFVARGAHLEALRTRGLRVRSPKGDLDLRDVRATDDPASIGPVDMVLFAVKLYSSEAAAHAIAPLIGAGTGVVTLQNGVDSVEVLTRAVGRPHVVGGVAYVASVISEPGVIVHTAMDQLIFGELDGHRTSRVMSLHEACVASGFNATISDNIEVDIWSKFVRLTVFSGMTAATRLPMGPLRADPEIYAMLLSAVDEGVAVGTAKGIVFAPNLMNELTAMVQGLPPQAKSSMLEDLERGKPLELPWLSGAVVRIGREVGVSTPIHQFIATVLKPYVNGRPRV